MTVNYGNMYDRWRQESGTCGECLISSPPAALQPWPSVQLQQGPAGACPSSLKHAPDWLPHLKGSHSPLGMEMILLFHEITITNSMILLHPLLANFLSFEGLPGLSLSRGHGVHKDVTIKILIVVMLATYFHSVYAVMSILCISSTVFT